MPSPTCHVKPAILCYAHHSIPSPSGHAKPIMVTVVLLEYSTLRYKLGNEYQCSIMVSMYGKGIPIFHVFSLHVNISHYAYHTHSFCSVMVCG
jgi:hypothetical protein